VNVENIIAMLMEQKSLRAKIFLLQKTKLNNNKHYLD